jgi:hypothetical protein
MTTIELYQAAVEKMDNRINWIEKVELPTAKGEYLQSLCEERTQLINEKDILGLIIEQYKYIREYFFNDEVVQRCERLIEHFKKDLFFDYSRLGERYVDEYCKTHSIVYHVLYTYTGKDGKNYIVCRNGDINNRTKKYRKGGISTMFAETMNKFNK